MTPEDFKAIRLAAKLTQKELSAIIGRSARQVGHWEMGNAEIPKPVALLMRYFQAYGLPDEALRRK